MTVTLADNGRATDAVYIDLYGTDTKTAQHFCLQIGETWI